MAFVIKSLHDLEGNLTLEAMLDSSPSLYLAHYDPDANDGAGAVAWTHNIDEALQFADAGEAWECYRRPSRAKPLRLDGLPNRPLTALTITIEDVDDSNPKPGGRVGRKFRELMNTLRSR
jgi:hypothetical protein